MADTTISTETLSALTTAMTSLTEALNRDAKEREEAKAAQEAAAQNEAPHPLDVALAVAEAKLPKAYAERVIEAVKNGTAVEAAVLAAKTELTEVLREAGATVAPARTTVRIGAPTGDSAATESGRVTVAFGELDISEAALDRYAASLTSAKG